jgi:hypothetical protein
MVDLVNEQVGAETNLKVVYEEKKLKIEVVYDGKQADVNLVVIVEPRPPADPNPADGAFG